MCGPRLTPSQVSLQKTFLEGQQVERTKGRCMARAVGTKPSILRITYARTPLSAQPQAPHAGAEPPAGRPGAPGAPAPDLGATGRAPLEGCSPPLRLAPAGCEALRPQRRAGLACR